MSVIYVSKPVEEEKEEVIKEVFTEEKLSRITNEAWGTIQQEMPGDYVSGSGLPQGLRDNVAEWAKEKGHLIELMRKSPDWNEDLLSIRKSFTFRRPFNRGRVRNTISQILSNARSRGTITGEIEAELSTQLFRLKFLNAPNILPGTLILYDRRVESKTLSSALAGKRPVEGQKATRYIRSVMLDAGIQVEAPEYRRAFQLMCDAFSESETPFDLYLSVHPSDYLTMSRGNSWSSCHLLADGCYRRGTFSYMTDNSTIVTYVLPRDDDASKPVFNRGKHYRRVVMLSPNDQVIMQCRIYPSSENPTFLNDYSTAVNNAIAEFMVESGHTVTTPDGIPKPFTSYCTYFGRNNTGHYPDYSYESNTQFFVLTDGLYRASDDIRSIGGIVYCLDCGSPDASHRDPESLWCSSCSGDHWSHDDEYYYDDDDY